MTQWRVTQTADKHDTKSGVLDSVIAIARKYRPYKAQEQLELLRQYKRTHDNKIRDDILYHNVGFGIYMVRRYFKYNVSRADLTQEMLMGLTRAIETFDPNASTKFTTWAAYWIRALVERHIKSYLSPVRDTKINRLSEIPKYIYIDTPYAAREAGTDKFITVEEESPNTTPEEIINLSERQREFSRVIEKALSQIPSKVERAIVRARYLQEDPPTLEKVGKSVKKCRETTRKLQKRGITRLTNIIRTSREARELLSA